MLIQINICFRTHLFVAVLHPIKLTNTTCATKGTTTCYSVNEYRLDQEHLAFRLMPFCQEQWTDELIPSVISPSGSTSVFQKDMITWHYELLWTPWLFFFFWWSRNIPRKLKTILYIIAALTVPTGRQFKLLYCNDNQAFMENYTWKFFAIWLTYNRLWCCYIF